MDAAGVGPGDGPNGTADGSPAILSVFNGSVSSSLPAGGGEVPFVVPDGPYLELLVEATGPVTALGNAGVAAVAPDGTRHALLAGTYAQHDDLGLAVPGATCTCLWRLPYEDGDWVLQYGVVGELELPLAIHAQ